MDALVSAYDLSGAAGTPSPAETVGFRYQKIYDYELGQRKQSLLRPGQSKTLLNTHGPS